MTSEVIDLLGSFSYHPLPLKNNNASDTLTCDGAAGKNKVVDLQKRETKFSISLLYFNFYSFIFLNVR